MTEQIDAWTILIAQTKTTLEQMTDAPSRDQKDAMKAVFTLERRDEIENEWSEALSANLHEGYLHQLILGQAADWASDAVAII